MSGKTDHPTFFLRVDPSTNENPSLDQAFTISSSNEDVAIADRMTTTVEIGLHILYASWNRPCCLIPKEQLLQTKLCQSIPLIVRGDNLNTSITATSSVIQVDETDEALDLLIGDCSCCSLSTTMPCPPENFPALAVVVKTFSGNSSEGPVENVVIRYVSSLDSKGIIDYLSHHRDKELPSNVIQEVQDILRESIPYDGSVMLTQQQNNSKPSSYVQQSQKREEQGEAIRIFVAGDRMSVGKTSVCLGLLGTLVQKFHYHPNELAYIKPATQNENPQLVQRYCERMGIECVSVGPIVYYRGFTRAFLAGDTESTNELLSKVEIEVDRVAQGKRVVLVDGVGFPAVGSICGTDNASVARASGYPPTLARGGVRRPMGVVLVGGPGVGSAVDGFNLNATYFESQNVPVMGVIYNKLSLEGFYSLENCKEQITSYFDQNRHQQQLGRRPFGFVPLFQGIAGDGNNPLDHVDEFLELFSSHVDVASLLEAANIVQRNELPLYGMSIDGYEYHDEPKNYGNYMHNNNGGPPPTKKLKLGLEPMVEGTAMPLTATEMQRSKRTREEIEGRAIQAGAAPSA